LNHFAFVGFENIAFARELEKYSFARTIGKRIVVKPIYVGSAEHHEEEDREKK
jgi:hypothetical protein